LHLGRELDFFESYFANKQCWFLAIGSAIGIHAKSIRPRTRPGVPVGKQNQVYQATVGVGANL